MPLACSAIGCHSEVPTEVGTEESLRYDSASRTQGADKDAARENVSRLHHGKRVEGSVHRRNQRSPAPRLGAQAEEIRGFTARYCVTELVYLEGFGNVCMAIAREKQLKGWLRTRKIALIESFNPQWKDLSAELQKTSPEPKARRDSSLRSE